MIIIIITQWTIKPTNFSNKPLTISLRTRWTKWINFKLLVRRSNGSKNRQINRMNICIKYSSHIRMKIAINQHKYHSYSKMFSFITFSKTMMPICLWIISHRCWCLKIKVIIYRVLPILSQTIALAFKLKALCNNNRYSSNKHFLTKVSKALKINFRIKSQPLIWPHLIVSWVKMAKMLNIKIILITINNVLNKYHRIINCK